MTIHMIECLPHHATPFPKMPQMKGLLREWYLL
jgi:hypothetical protein